MKKLILIASCILLILLITFIIISSSIFVALPSVEEFAQNYYRNFNNRNFDYMYKDMSCDEFKEAMSLEKYKGIMNRVYTDRGPVKAWEKGSTGIKYTVKGFYVTVPYITQREKGVVSEEFILKRDKKVWLLYRFDIKA